MMKEGDERGSYSIVIRLPADVVNTIDELISRLHLDNASTGQEVVHGGHASTVIHDKVLQTFLKPFSLVVLRFHILL